MSWDPNAGGNAQPAGQQHSDYYGNDDDQYNYYGGSSWNAGAVDSGGYAAYGGFDGGGGGGGYGGEAQDQTAAPVGGDRAAAAAAAATGFAQQQFYNPNDYAPQAHQRHVAPAAAAPQQAPQPPQQPPSLAGFTMIPGIPSSASAVLADPVVTGIAMQYGQDFLGKGRDEIKSTVDKYVSIGQLKYYFAVDTAYVGKKLGALLFPFARADWSLKYNQDEPVQPKYDVNAPDLYIPCMAFVTFILAVGYILGIKNMFSPDLLAATASSALVWLILEIALTYLTLTVASIRTTLGKWDVIAFSGYKYVSMTPLALAGLLTGRAGYYAALLYAAAALGVFLVRTLRLRIEPEGAAGGMATGMHAKRKLSLMLTYAALQPAFMWWMTSHLITESVVIPQSQQQPPQVGDFAL